MSENIDFGNRIDDEITQIFQMFFFASLVLLFAGLRTDHGFYYYIAPGHILVYFILGLLHAFVDLNYIVSPRINLNVYWKDNTQKRMVELFQFLLTIFFYIGVYQCIMLPPIGLGLVEFLSVVVLLSIILWNMSKKEHGACTKPQMIVGLILVLFLIKTLLYFMPEDIYREIVDGNPAARKLIVLTFIITGYIAIFRKRSFVSDKQLFNAAGKAGKVISKIVSMTVKLFVKLINLILSLLSGPVLVITLAAIGLIISFLGLAIFAKIESMITDIFNLISSILRPLCSTGKYTAYPDFVFCIIQVIIIITYIIYWNLLYNPRNLTEEKKYIREYIIQQNKDKADYDEGKTQQFIAEYLDDINSHNIADKIFNTDNVSSNLINKNIKE